MRVSAEYMEYNPPLILLISILISISLDGIITQLNQLTRILLRRKCVFGFETYAWTWPEITIFTLAARSKDSRFDFMPSVLDSFW